VRYYVIGDEDTVLGFRYAGVPGDFVETPDQARAALERVARMPDVGILIVTDVVADRIREEVNAIRFGRAAPLVVEVPGPGGPSPKRRDLLALIREAVGIRV
jgi:V/A-type H+-transporting ATPase subunit F